VLDPLRGEGEGHRVFLSFDTAMHHGSVILFTNLSGS
jgi:hypothetical protein